MPNSLPFPVRVAAGLLATGIQTIRTLPQQLPGMSVEVIGTVTKVGLRLQQEVSELAARGDEFLESRREPEEHPAWARFDDEEAEAVAATEQSTAATDQPADADPADPTADSARTSAPAPAPRTTTAATPTAATPAAAPPAAANPAAAPPAAAPAAASPGPDTGRAPAGNLPLDGYDAMTIGQVRGHLRQLSRDDVRALLEHEAAAGNRASFLTLLANRITTLEHNG